MDKTGPRRRRSKHAVWNHVLYVEEVAVGQALDFALYCHVNDVNVTWIGRNGNIFYCVHTAPVYPLCIPCG
jgi:hypothetical protein